MCNDCVSLWANAIKTSLKGFDFEAHLTEQREEVCYLLEKTRLKELAHWERRWTQISWETTQTEKKNF